MLGSYVLLVLVGVVVAIILCVFASLALFHILVFELHTLYGVFVLRVAVDAVVLFALCVLFGLFVRVMCVVCFVCFA